MLKFSLSCAALLLAVASPVAADAPPKADADLAEQFLGCGYYFALLPSLSDKNLQGEQLARVKELENFSRLAALALVGKEHAKLASAVARNGFSEELRQADAKGDEAVLQFLRSWSDRCTTLMDQQASGVAPRIEAYVASDMEAREKGDAKP
ncbi:MAG TPA: hypothetical protein VGE22_18985 [Solimonas sp.]